MPPYAAASKSSKGKRKEVPSAATEPRESFDAIDWTAASDSEADDLSFHGSDDEAEPFPEIDVADDGESSEEAEELDEDAEYLRELEEEAAVERELAEEEDSASDDGLDGLDPAEALDTLFAKNSVKPFEASSAQPLLNGAKLSLAELDDNIKILGYDPRPYKDKARRVQSEITGEPQFEWDEIEPGYGSESGGEESSNRVGNIPSHFYDDMPHIGYDIDGKRVMRPAKGDELDKFLANVDGSSW